MVGLSSDRAGSTFVARTDVHGAYIWRPELDQWVQLVTEPAMPPAYRTPASMFGGVAGIVVAPSDGQRLYMAVKGTVFRSEDQGKSWQVPDTGPFPVRFGAKKKFLRSDPVLAVSPDNPDIVYFGTAHDGVLRSTDGGRNWARVDGLPATAGTGGGRGCRCPSRLDLVCASRGRHKGHLDPDPGRRHVCVGTRGWRVHAFARARCGGAPHAKQWRIYIRWTLFRHRPGWQDDLALSAG
ncbi:WD40/YVTN/BNR-like repeat-containing protein [Sphingobium sp. Ant17]|uniref:WD40/YVTN/BNR-like repeat-containing protein n=1 Tax=Sphingobium sp. Ant17 TaxID=1461752 RepID=UPI001F424195|nr:hypothetical protein [Sphingobium sp. Ant17]